MAKISAYADLGELTRADAIPAIRKNPDGSYSSGKFGIDAIDAKIAESFDALADAVQADEIVGSQSTPGAGSAKATNGTYWFAAPLENMPFGATIEGHNDRGTAGTIKLKLAGDDGALLHELAIAVPAGAYSIELDGEDFSDISPEPGQFVGIWTGGVLASSDSCVNYTGGAGLTETPYRFKAGDADHFDPSAAPTLGNRVEVRIVFHYDYVTAKRVKDIEASVDGLDAQFAAISAGLKEHETVGRPEGAPVNGTIASVTSFFYADPMPGPGIIRRVRGYNPQTAPALLLIRKCSVDGSVASTLGIITVAPGPFSYDLVADGLLEVYPALAKGEFRGFHPGASVSADGPSHNSVTFLAAAADGAGYYINGQSSPTSAVGIQLGAPTTNSQLQIGFDVEYYPNVNAELDQLREDVEAISAGSDTPSSRFERLYARFMAGRDAARKGNVRSSGAPASPPTLTLGTVAPSAPYAAFPNGVTSAASYASACKVTGGWLGYNAGSIFPFGVTRTIGAQTGGSSSYQTAHRIIFSTTAQVIYLAFMQSKLVKLRLIVDGQYVDANGFTASAVNVLNYLKVDFGSPRYSGRRVEFEVQGGPVSGSNNLTQFKGWYKDPTSMIWAGAPGLRMMIAGDSLTVGPTDAQIGAGLSQLCDGYARIAGDLLGIDDLWQSGLSGTGWLWQSGGSFPNLNQRLSDITGNNLDIAVIAMGANDIFNFGSTNSETPPVTLSAATIKARVTLLLQSIRAACPHLPVIVLGPFTNASASAVANQVAVENAISAGVAACNDKLLAFRPTIASNFITGTGLVTGPTGDGNADWMRCADATHWTLNGHAYAGNRLASEIVAGMDAIRAALAA